MRGVDLHVPPKCDTRISAKGGRVGGFVRKSVRAGSDRFCTLCSRVADKHTN